MLNSWGRVAGVAGPAQQAQRSGPAGQHAPAATAPQHHSATQSCPSAPAQEPSGIRHLVIPSRQNTCVNDYTSRQKTVLSKISFHGAAPEHFSNRQFVGVAQSVIMQLPSQASRQSLTISTTTIALRQEWWSPVSTCPHWPRSKTVYEPRSMRSSICTGVRPGTLDSHSCRRTSSDHHEPRQD